MDYSRGKARPFRLGLAIACTALASVGFVGASFVSTSTADAVGHAASAGAPHASATVTARVNGAVVSVPATGYRISFASTVVSSTLPPAVLNLTGPQFDNSHFAKSAALLDDYPEIPANLVSQVRQQILAAAYQGLGHNYVWGGTSFSEGWDCSGFVQWAYRQAGVLLPRTEQWYPMIETNTPQPGDLVAQNPDGPDHWSHVGTVSYTHLTLPTNREV